jgi:hypothetical protein
MITFTSGSAASRGTLSVRDAHIAAVDPFYTLSTGQWDVDIRNNTRMGASAQPFITPPIVSGPFKQAGRVQPQLKMVSGGWYGPPTTPVTCNPNVDNLYYTPLWIPRTTAFNLIGIYVTDTAGATTATVRLGVYEDLDEFPGALIQDYGTITTNATGQLTLGISLTRRPGLIWLAAVAHTASPQVRGNNVGILGGFFAMYGSPCYVQSGVTGTLPSDGSGAGRSGENPTIRVALHAT